MADLTLPGDIPGLLRRGSPVWIKHAMGRWPAVVEKDPEEHDREGGHQMIKFGTHFVGARSVFLDLSDPTGRAHAAWWLMLRHTGTKVATCASWGPYKSWQRIYSPALHTGDGMSLYTDKVEKLCIDLDWSDPRLLPDGSKWVYAEALRRVVLHVAGREVSG